MANTLNLGNGNWATKKDSLLAYNSENGNFKPLPFDFTRASSATRVNKAGLIETVGSGEPRIDFSNDAKGALKLEPSRSNLLPYSGNFSTWAEVFAEGTISDIISPNGTDYGIKITDNNVSNTHRIQLGVTTASSGSFTYSLFLKKGTLTTAYFQVFNGTTASNANVDLENGTITSGGLGVNHTIEDYGNDWYRCSISGNLISTATTVYLYTKQNGSYVGNGDYLYAWGAQLEQGSYATSYIPTQGSSVTRVAESCSDAGNEQVINSIEGVLYWNIITQDSNSSSKAISINNGSNTILSIYFYSSSINVIFNVNGVNQFYANFGLTIGQEYKIAVLYQENNFALYVNGVKRAEDTNGSVPSVDTFDRLNLSEVSGSKFYGNVKEVKLYNTALTDQELINLTTI